MDHPVVSVIIPCYNAGKYIEETLDSVAAQTLQAWECLIVDDESTDHSWELISNYTHKDPRYRIFQQANAGSAAARNTGLQHAAGEYIQFLDADDLIAPTKLERQVEFLKHHPEVDIVCGPIFAFRDTNRTTFLPMTKYNTFVAQYEDDPACLLQYYREENPITAIHAALGRRLCYEEIGGFDPNLRAAEDYDFWIRCIEANKRFAFDLTTRTEAYYRLHPSNKQGNRQVYLQLWRKFYQKHGKRIANGHIRCFERAVQIEAFTKNYRLITFLRAAWRAVVWRDLYLLGFAGLYGLFGPQKMQQLVNLDDRRGNLKQIVSILLSKEL